MRRKLRVGSAAALLAALLIAAGGCSSSAPPPGPSGPGGGDAGSTAVQTDSQSGGPSDVTTPRSVSASADGSVTQSVSGLSAECAATIDAQLAITDMFGGPVEGHRLTTKDVSDVFDAISADIPSQLDPDIATMHDAAKRAVGKSDIQVATILAEKAVAAASATISAFVNGCSPPTD